MITILLTKKESHVLSNVALSGIKNIVNQQQT